MPFLFKAKASYPALDFMADDDEMRVTEVASVVGVPVGTVKSWCATGKLKSRNDPDAGGRGSNSVRGVRQVRVADLRLFLEGRR